MISSLLIAIRRGIFPALVPALVPASPSPASPAPSQRREIAAVIRSVFQAEDDKDMSEVHDLTWPEGYLVSRLGGPGGGTIRRHWSDLIFGGIGVFYRTRMARPAIRVRGDRATALVRSSTRRYYDDEFSGMYDLSRNRVELERRHGEWRILDWYRRIRSYGSDAAWHRRHP